MKLLVEWKAPALFDDVIEISVRATRFGTTSFTLGFEIRRAGDGALLVTGETVNVHAHRVGDAWVKAPVPAETQRRLAEAAAGKSINHAGRVRGRAVRAR